MASNNYILDQKNSTEFSFWVFRSAIRFLTNLELSKPNFDKPGPDSFLEIEN